MYAALGKIMGYVTCAGHRYGWVCGADSPSSTTTFSFFKLFLARSSTLVTAPSLPSSRSVLVCDVLCFQTHQPAPSFSSPPASESLFAMCHVSRLTSTLLPLPPLQQVNPYL